VKTKIIIFLAVLLLGGIALRGATTAEAAPPPRGPDPYIHPFAGKLGGEVRRPGPKRGPVPLPEGVDGCDHGYGIVSQCVPWKLPRDAAKAPCGWLAAHGLASLPLPNRRDRHRLDTNGDLIACGPGDGA
jgi:hypothetical protein